ARRSPPTYRPFPRADGSGQERTGAGNLKRAIGLTEKRTENGHLLIMRLSAMGDVAMTVPVVAALRQAYPSLRISVLTRTGFRPFFRGIPDLTFVDFDPAGRHKGFFGLVRLACDIGTCGADTVADLHDVLRTKVVRTLVRLRGMRVAVIDKGRKEKKAMTRRAGKRLVPLAPTTERYRHTIRRLGFDFDMP